MSTVAGGWRVAFEMAWEAHRNGSIAVGAAVVDANGAVLVADRSRSAESDGPPGLLFGSRLAHAEVNALARLEHTMPTGMRLLTTLQPCVLCAGACSSARVPVVEYAAYDAAWAGVEAMHTASAVLAERAPVMSWRDLGPWSVWAEALPLAAVQRRYGRGGRVGAAYAAANPAMVELAAAVAADDGLAGLDLDSAFGRWVDRLATVPATRAAP